MLTGSFYSGLSGLQASATALSVVGNNLANINTTGFKRSQANFGQIMSNKVSSINGSGNPNQIGLGTRVSEIVAKFEQGSIQTTGIKTHLAIQGEGFFQVRNADGTNKKYTRSGNFGFDEEGYLTAYNGGRVQGHLGTNPDGTVNTDGDIGDVKIDLGEASPPRATERVRFVANVSAEAAAGESYTNTIEIFDSKGVAHQLNVTYTKTGNPGEWDYEFTFPDGAISPLAGQQGTGTITFGADGNLASVDGTAITAMTANRTIGLINLNTGAADMLVEWDLVEFSSDPSIPNSGIMTSYGNLFNTGTLFQDGFGSGVLQDIDFAQDGTLIGFYDNGQTLELARVALATFNNKLGLKQVDGGFYVSTAASGPASIDGEGTGGKGAILSSSLEASNVDIAEEFTSLIVNQRGYQSNSRTITTTDQLLQDALSLKR